MKLDIDPTAYVDPAAHVVGNVAIGPRASVWATAVLRADLEHISVGADSNIQEGCVVHVDVGRPAVIGERVTVGHRAVIHGATVEEDCLIGMGAVVLNGARVGAGSLVAAGAVVTEDMEIPPRSLVAGVPARVRKEVPEALAARMRENLAIYAELVRKNQSGELPRRG